MTNKITKEVLFTELSIKLAIMDAKLDKLIELVMTPEVENQLESPTDYDPTKPYGFTHETIK